MAHEIRHGEAGERTERTHIQMPGPTFWPMVFAFGVTLLFAGLLTQYVVGIVGAIIAVRAAVGWWRDVIPVEEHEQVPIDPLLRPAPILVEARSVVRLKAGEGKHRVRIPAEIHPYSAGLWGGLAGGAVMAGLACLYGLIAQHSIWYPINLLAGAVIPDLGQCDGTTTESIQRIGIFRGAGGARRDLDSGRSRVRGNAADVPEIRAVLGRNFGSAVLDRVGCDGAQYAQSSNGGAN